MNFVVRAAETLDAHAIRAVHLAAFPTPAEADLVERLAGDRDAVLSLLAEDGGEVVGHLLMSRMRVEGDGRAVRALGLAPVAVRPDRQGEGIGSALIVEALSLARAAGEELVFVVGEPDYYRRFGFSTAAAAPFASPYAGPYFMATALGEAAPPGSGRADYPAAFDGLE